MKNLNDIQKQTIKRAIDDLRSAKSNIDVAIAELQLTVEDADVVQKVVDEMSRRARASIESANESVYDVLKIQSKAVAS